jgi:flagellar hook-associated protein 3 FlgL
VSKEQDADFLETYTNLQNQQTILQAALKTGANVMMTSLVDFVR